MRNLLLGSAVGMAGLLTISCSDEAAGPLGPSSDPAAAPEFTGEMRIVLPEPGTRVHATMAFLVAVEQQVHPEAGSAYGVVEMATGQNDWQAIREFSWSAQSTDFSVEVAPDVPGGPCRLRVVIRDGENRQIRLASQSIELIGSGLATQEVALTDPRRPPRRTRESGLSPDGRGDAHWQIPELVAPDKPEDTLRLRVESPLDPDSRGGAVPVPGERVVD